MKLKHYPSTRNSFSKVEGVPVWEISEENLQEVGPQILCLVLICNLGVYCVMIYMKNLQFLHNTNIQYIAMIPFGQLFTDTKYLGEKCVR